MQDRGSCNSISASARFGCWNLHVRSQRSEPCRIMTGRSSCSSVRSASSPAGGTATTSPATTSSPACRTKRSCGSIASGAAKEDGTCTAFSPEAVYSPLPAYAELHCLSNFTFLRGASHPEELVKRAAALGYRALALTDERSEEHTSELQSQSNLVCRLLLEKKNNERSMNKCLNSQVIGSTTDIYNINV